MSIDFSYLVPIPRLTPEASGGPPGSGQWCPLSKRHSLPPPAPAMLLVTANTKNCVASDCAEMFKSDTGFPSTMPETPSRGPLPCGGCCPCRGARLTGRGGRAQVSLGDRGAGMPGGSCMRGVEEAAGPPQKPTKVSRRGGGQRKEEDWGQKPRGGPRSWEGRQVYLTLPRRLPQKQEAVRVAGERWAQPGEEQGAWGRVPRVLGCPLPRAVAACPGRPARGPAHQGQEPRPPPGAAPRAPRAPRCLVSVRDRIWPALRSTGSTLSCRPLSTAESLGSEKPSRCQDHAGK